MVDVVDKATRSRMMSGIRGKNTGPELALRKAMHANGFRFRLHARDLPGRPDLVFPKHRAVVLVHGCFWHRHTDCRFATSPATNVEFWAQKFAGNVARDARNVERLHEVGWRTAIIWECEMRTQIDQVAERLSRWLGTRSRRIEIPSRRPNNCLFRESSG